MKKFISFYLILVIALGLGVGFADLLQPAGAPAIIVQLAIVFVLPLFLMFIAWVINKIMEWGMG